MRALRRGFGSRSPSEFNSLQPFPCSIGKQGILVAGAENFLPEQEIIGRRPRVRGSAAGQMCRTRRRAVVSARAAGVDAYVQVIDLAPIKRGISFCQNDGGRSAERYRAFRTAGSLLRQM